MFRKSYAAERMRRSLLLCPFARNLVMGVVVFWTVNGWMLIAVRATYSNSILFVPLLHCIAVVQAPDAELASFFFGGCKGNIFFFSNTMTTIGGAFSKNLRHASTITELKCGGVYLVVPYFSSHSSFTSS